MAALTENTTIAAIATSATAAAGISIVRVSGPDSFEIVDKIYRGKNKSKRLTQQKSHTIHYGYICASEEENAPVIDEVLVMLMRGPRSYTGEDTVEIDCHGGIYVTRKILEAVIEAGAQPAQPGEFTKRAFLNGKMDLSKAESVADIIEAKGELARKNSVRHLQGDIYNKIVKMRNEILDDISFIEAGMDDPEHIELDGFSSTVHAHVQDLLQQTFSMKRNADSGIIMNEGLRVAIVGKPNAGKSSLLNCLCGTQRAIVTDLAGTTRDILEESVRLPSSGLVLILQDTAGIHETGNIVEKIGVERSVEASKEADLVLFVVDSSSPLDRDDKEIYNLIREKKHIVVLNKSDLSPSFSEANVLALLEASDSPKTVTISALENAGIDRLETAVTDLFFGGELSFNDEIYLSNSRQIHELDQARRSLELVRDAIESGMPEDLYVIDLMNVYTALGNIIGESLEEDVIDRVFAKFCMGK